MIGLNSDCILEFIEIVIFQYVEGVDVIYFIFDYVLDNVFKKVVCIIFFYIDYINCMVWYKEIQFLFFIFLWLKRRFCCLVLQVWLGIWFIIICNVWGNMIL